MTSRCCPRSSETRRGGTVCRTCPWFYCAREGSVLRNRAACGQGAQTLGLARKKLNKFNHLVVTGFRSHQPIKGSTFVAGEEPIVAGMAGRYATALFDLAQEANALDAVAKDLNSLRGLIDGSDDMKRLVRSPVFTADEQTGAINAILDRLSVHALTRKFVGLVAKNRRLFALRDMARAYAALLAKHRGEMTATVTSAHPLSDAQVTSLKATLKQSFKLDVNLTTDVDPALLGGLVVKVGSRMIDTSLKTKLDNLQLAMKEA